MRASGRDYCAHESAIVRGPQRRCGRAVAWQRSGLASTNFCAPGGSGTLLWNVPLVARVV